MLRFLFFFFCVCDCILLNFCQNFRWFFAGRKLACCFVCRTFVADTMALTRTENVTCNRVTSYECWLVLDRKVLCEVLSDDEICRSLSYTKAQGVLININTRDIYVPKCLRRFSERDCLILRSGAEKNTHEMKMYNFDLTSHGVRLNV